MKNILRILVFLVAIFGATISGAATLTVTVSDNTFAPNGVNPATVTINLGDTVKWVWGSGGSHTTTSTTLPTGAASWNATISSSSGSFMYVPSVTGTFRYACTAHSSLGMTGMFVVNCGSGPSKPVITSSNGNSACQDGTVYLRTAAQSFATYQWFNGMNPLPNTTNTLNATAGGSYTVKVRRCSIDSSSSPFLVTFYPNPSPSFTVAHNGLNYTFTNTTPIVSSHTYVWSFGDGSPNQTTTNAARTFLAHGNYTVTLKATTTITTCFASNNKVINTQLGVGTLGGESYSVTPNPARTKLNITTSIRADIALMDLRGRVAAIPATRIGKDFQLDISNLPSGLYILRIATDNAYAIEKIDVIH